MYLFKKIKADYDYQSEMIHPDGSRCVYRAKIPISVSPNLIEGLDVLLLGAESETINGNPPVDFDEIMSQLGHSLYPIILNVSKSGDIQRLKNFNEIKKRWESSCREMLTTHKNAYWLERYIQMTSKNIETEISCLESLKRNGFVQFFFIDEGKKMTNMMLYDFPKSGSRITAPFELVSSDCGIYTYKTQIDATDIFQTGQGDMQLVYTDQGLMNRCLLSFRVEVAEEGYYTQKIALKLNDK